jgi:hypothetical protein
MKINKWISIYLNNSLQKFLLLINRHYQSDKNGLQQTATRAFKLYIQLLLFVKFIIIWQDTVIILEILFFLPRFKGVVSLILICYLKLLLSINKNKNLQ